MGLTVDRPLCGLSAVTLAGAPATHQGYSRDFNFNESSTWARGSSFSRNQRCAGIAGRQQQRLSIAEKHDTPVVAFGIAKACAGSLPGSFFELAASVAGRCLHKPLEKIARVERPGGFVLLEGGDDHRGSVRGSFDFKIVIGLPQRPEGGHGDADVSAGNGVDSGLASLRVARAAWRWLWACDLLGEFGFPAWYLACAWRSCFREVSSG